MPEKTRKIIHIDMDAFYASVEIRDDPSLCGKPVIVGGLPGTRGVVCTCSYPARKFGVHSGMSSNLARRLCPEGIFLKPRREAYLAVSRSVRKIFSDYAFLVEPLSLDEAFLDVSGGGKRGMASATQIAREIRARIRVETGGLTASAGVSYNKFLAKVASDFHKPDGLFVIPPGRAEAFLDPLPVGNFFGIGRVARKFLEEHGVLTGKDLRAVPLETLQKWFGGKNGAFYFEIARGIDGRSVNSSIERKSLGTEMTLASDTTDLVALYEILLRQAHEVSDALKARHLAGRTVTLKLKFFDFRAITRSRTLPGSINGAEEIAGACRGLLLQSGADKIPVRLIGVTVSHFPERPEPVREERAGAGEGAIAGGLVQGEFDFHLKEAEK